MEKKLVNILSMISVLAVLLLCIGYFFFLEINPRIAFITSWFMGIITIFAIPLFFKTLSLAYNKDRIKPLVWLIIDAIATVLYIVIIITLGFVDTTLDLPLAIREEYTTIEGVPENILFTESNQKYYVNGIKFQMDCGDFNTVKKESSYLFIYLPNSNYIIDIKNVDGISLQKR